MPGSPVLTLEKDIDSNGNGGYAFSIQIIDLTNWKEFCDSHEHPSIDPRALYIFIRSNLVYTVKAWLFEKFEDGETPKHSYMGKLPQGIGLGDTTSELLKYTHLEFN